MKTFKKFEAQLLTKKLMNNVKGGVMHTAICVTTNPQGIVVGTYKVQYEAGTENILQYIANEKTPVGCMTMCYRV